jgi:glycosyltransferase involved in cell wall biosynthesis
MNDQATPTPSYLLTIGIPTYCRADLLDLCLASVLPQVDESASLVECVVSDNASTDHTDQVLAKYKSRFRNLKVFRNETNIGIIGNITKTASELASGEYVLLIGDDDVLTSGAVARILRELLSGSRPDMIALNVGYLPRARRPKADDALGGVSGKFDKMLRSTTSRTLVDLNDAMEGPPADLTASYSVVLKRDNWRQVFPVSCHETPFSSLKTTYPSGFVIAETCQSGSVTILGEPSVVIYEMPGSEFSWARYRGITSTRYATELLYKFEQRGVSAEKLLPYKHFQLEHRNEELGELLWDKTTAGGWKDAFLFAWMLKRFPIRLTKCFALSLLHPNAPKLLSWIPNVLLRIKRASRSQ